MTATIDILLATYNGEKYLKQQLNSIVTQSFNEWRIIARDDQSCDYSNELLNYYKKQFPDKFLVINDQLGHVGILQNFSLLMQHSSAPYIMFCDQDDVWMPDKISITFNAMKIAESNKSPQIPLLVHTDLQVADEQLNIISRSFWKYQNINPQLDTFNRLLMQNTVTGCTVMVNRKLVDMALPIPVQTIMHDWWMGLIASALGGIVIIDRATVIYRQHAKNDTGAKHWSLSYVFRKALSFFDLLKTIALYQQQAEVFGERFDSFLSVAQKKTIDNLVKLQGKSHFNKRFFLYQHKLLKQGIIKNIGLFLRI